MAANYEDPMERFTETNYIVKNLGQGSVGKICLSIRKVDADRIQDQFNARRISEIEAFKRLRVALKTFKVLDTDPMMGLDLDDETEVLRRSNTINHPNLAYMLDRHSAVPPAHREWYQLEGFSGGNLEQYIQEIQNSDNPPNPSSSFGWHLIHQLSDGLLALFFGSPRGFPPRENWPMFFHGDVTAANMCFRKPNEETTSTSFPHLPDVVLVDFGVARTIQSPRDRPSFFRQQYQDVDDMLSVIQRLFARTTGVRAVVMRDVLPKLRRDVLEMENVLGPGNDNAALKGFLGRLGARAEFERSSPFRNLEPRAIVYFNRLMCTDDELRGIWSREEDQ